MRNGAVFETLIDHCKDCGATTARYIWEELKEDIRFARCATCAWQLYREEEARKKGINGYGRY